MLFKTKRRVTIFGGIVLLLILYFSRNLDISIGIGVTLVALLLFHYIDHAYKFDFPERYYIFILFIFSTGLIFGPEHPFVFYYKGVYYDKILHFFSPFLICFMIFFILNSLEITLKWKLLMTGALVMGILGLFEIGEYLLDVFLGYRLQGVFLADYAKEIINYEQIVSPIDDTMQDLIWGLVGCLSFVFYKWIHVKGVLKK